MSPPILDMNKKTCLFGGTLRRDDATNDLQPLDFGGTYRRTNYILLILVCMSLTTYGETLLDR